MDRSSLPIVGLTNPNRVHAMSINILSSYRNDLFLFGYQRSPKENTVPSYIYDCDGTFIAISKMVTVIEVTRES